MLFVNEYKRFERDKYNDVVSGLDYIILDIFFQRFAFSYIITELYLYNNYLLVSNYVFEIANRI